MKIGMTSIAQPFGRDFIYGRNQPRKKHMKKLKKN
jgi:hypothetical protein